MGKLVSLATLVLAMGLMACGKSSSVDSGFDHAAVDLSATVEGPTLVRVWESQALTIRLRNLGPDTARDVRLAYEGTGPIELVDTDGGDQVEGGLVWQLPGLAAGASAEYRVQFVATSASGGMTHRVTASSDMPDAQMKNNDGTLVALFETVAYGVLASGGRLHMVISGCSGVYPAQSDALNHLPFSAGETYQVVHGNCSTPGTSHEFEGSAGFMYAYDFGMPVGTPVLAARDGIVHSVLDSWSDTSTDEAHANYVIVTHEDGTASRYRHLASSSVVVASGEAVAQGQLIAYSGSSGTSGSAHLHFDVTGADCETIGCPTRPVAFANTSAHDNGLVVGQYYKAEVGR